MTPRETIAQAIMDAALVNGSDVNPKQAEHMADSVLEALGAKETRHSIKISNAGYTVQHPLMERLTGSLFDCEIHEYEIPEWWDEAPASQFPDGLYWGFFEDEEFKVVPQ